MLLFLCVVVIESVVILFVLYQGALAEIFQRGTDLLTDSRGIASLVYVLLYLLFLPLVVVKKDLGLNFVGLMGFTRNKVYHLHIHSSSIQAS